MLRNIFLKTLRDSRFGFFWWSLGLTALTLVTVLFYPAVKDAQQFDTLLEERAETLAAFTGEVASLTSPEGYLTSQLFFFIIPLLFIVFAVGAGARAIAGEEERGTLGVLLSAPLSRTRILAEKWLALLFTSALVAGVFLGVTVLAILGIEMEISLLRVGGATFMAWLVGILFGTLTFLLGAWRGRRGVAIGASAGLAMGSYLVNALAPSVEALEPWRNLSVFYYYAKPDPLVSGLDWSNVAILAVTTLAFFIVSLFAFRKRDIGV